MINKPTLNDYTCKTEILLVYLFFPVKKENHG